MIVWRTTDGRMGHLLVAMALMLTLLMVAGPPPASADPTDPLRITLEGTTPDVLGLDEDLTFNGILTNDSDEEVESVTVWWRIQTAVLDEDLYSDWFAGEDHTEPLTMARHDLPDPIAPGRSIPFSMDISAEESSPFDSASAPGARGIELIVTGRTSDGETLRGRTRSTLIWYPEAGATPARTTVALPLTPTPQEWEQAHEEGSAVARASAPRILDLLAAMDGAPVTWGLDAALLDPTPVDQLSRVVPVDEDDPPDPPGTDPLEWERAPEIDEIVEALEDSSGDARVIPLGWATPAHNSLAHAGTEGEHILSTNDDYARDLLTREGLSWHRGIVWSFDAMPPSAVARIIDGPATVIIPPTPGGGYSIPPTVNELAVVSPDADLIDLLLSQTEPRELLTRSLIRAEPSPTVVLTLPRDLDGAGAKTLRDNLEALSDVPWMEFAPPSPSGQFALPASSPAPDTPLITPEEVSALSSTLARASALAEITDDPRAFDSVVATATFQAVSNVWGDDPPPRGITEALRRATDEPFLEIEQPSTVNLISQDGSLPVGVTNSSILDLHPTVVVEPADARLLAEEPVTSSLPAGQSTTVQLPITAVANGNVEATIRLLDPEGNQIAEPQTFMVRVRADWESTGTAVIAGVVVVGFLYGLVRNIRKSSSKKAQGKNE